MIFNLCSSDVHHVILLFVSSCGIHIYCMCVALDLLYSIVTLLSYMVHPTATAGEANRRRWLRSFWLQQPAWAAQIVPHPWEAQLFTRSRGYPSRPGGPIAHGNVMGYLGKPWMVTSVEPNLWGIYRCTASWGSLGLMWIFRRARINQDLWLPAWSILTSAICVPSTKLQDHSHGIHGHVQ